MRSIFQKKVWVILLAVLALGSLTVLALSLDKVSFRDPQQYSHEPSKPLPPISFDDMTDPWQGIPLWKIVVVWGLVGLLIVLVALLLSPEQRIRLLKLILRIAIIIYVFYYMVKNYGQALLSLRPTAVVPQDPNAAANAPPMPVFQPPHISSLLSFLISFACVFAAAGLMVALYLGWKRYVGLTSSTSLDEIARIARTSLRDLSSGHDSSDVIINCYLRMSDVVADKRHLQRGIAMTPHEFAQRLERAGLPGDAVRRLTGLFEMVRYGDRKSAPKDVTEAVNCLNAILRSCGEAI